MLIKPFPKYNSTTKQRYTIKAEYYFDVPGKKFIKIARTKGEQKMQSKKRLYQELLRFMASEYALTLFPWQASEQIHNTFSPAVTPRRDAWE